LSKPGPRVAIVDNDPGMLEALEDLLESAGYVARTFLTAGPLLASDLSELDLLVVDIGIPGMDGFEVRDLVNKTRPELPVFLISGRHDITDQDHAQSIGGFFQKPFDAQALLAAITNTLRTRD
jgi:FixJ family two-component response regulator